MKKIHFSKPDFNPRDYNVMLKVLNPDGLPMDQKTWSLKKILFSC